jgi:hypothetical protein
MTQQRPSRPHFRQRGYSVGWDKLSAAFLQVCPYGMLGMQHRGAGNDHRSHPTAGTVSRPGRGAGRDRERG